MSKTAEDTAPMNSLQVILKTLRPIFKKLWPFFALLVLITIGVMLLELAPPILLREIVDHHLKNRVLQGIWTIATLYLAASIASSIVGFAKTLVTSYLGQNILLELRVQLSAHLTKLSIHYFSRTPVGEIMSRFTSDVDAVDSLFSSGLVNAFTDLLKVFGIVWAMYYISPKLCLWVLVVLPFIYLLTNYFRKNIFKAQVGVRKNVGQINIFIQEAFSGIGIIKAYHQERRFEESFQKPLQDHFGSLSRIAIFNGYFPCIMQVLRAITIAVIIWLGAKTGLPGTAGITIGSLAAMADLIGRLFNPIDSLAQEFQTIQQATAGLRRIGEFFSEKPEPRGEMQIVPPTLDSRLMNIEIKAVEFGYAPEKTIIKGVSMSIPFGSKIAIVGRTGAGKTTLLNLIAGLYTPAAGSITIGGFDPHRVDPAGRRSMLGIVPQNIHIFEGTIRENITLRDSTISEAAIVTAAKLVGLDDFINSLPEKYETPLGDTQAKLSFGQNQLLSMARAIVADPPLLLLDEPTSGMDAITEAKIFDAFRSISRQRTIITISHRLSGILEADEVYIMAAGKIVQSGSPQKLTAEQGWYSVFKQLEDLEWEN